MAPENDPFATLRAPRAAIPWDRPAQAPRDATTERIWIGADPHGLAFEVAVALWSGANPPTQEAMRALHAARLRNRAIPLTVVARRASGQAWLFGPLANAPLLGPLPVGHAARIVQAALDEPTAGAARARIIQARDALETADIPGFDSQGLFAIRELTWGVPRRPDWVAASARSRALMATSPRGAALVQGLGFESRTIAGNALLLSVHGEPPRAVAILLRDDESFDAESARFAKSPIYHGLEIARQNNVRWLVVARGPQLRLYPTAPDVGVGRRGATQTYFGIDLALLDDQHAGYLELAFGAAALAPGGSVDQLLDASRDYAVSLGERLRERIYEKVVDSLSTAIARALATDARLDEPRLALAYRLTLRILFRLLFQAYAEDTRLLPLHRNERYTRASLKELARDLATHPERPNDPHSTSLWDGLAQVWRVIDSGDEAWGVPAYNGGLFGSDPVLHPDGAAIARLVLHNDAVGPALAGLLVDVTVDGSRGPVDFRSLDVRDFGTIYEGLLESGLSLASEDLTVDANGAWRPARLGERVDATAGAPYFHTKSGERKATGSYFTKPFAVEHLLERALDPVLDAHLDKVAALVGKGDQVGAARLLFDFRVADLAMGSGHFLVGAIGHIEAKYGAFLERNAIPGVERELLELRDAAVDALSRVGVAEPEIDRSALLGRQIARRCVYGLDINDIAVELARLAIWVRTFVPGLPMSSLDHQLVCANSLTGIGTIEEALEALDPGARSGAITFSGAAIRSALEHARVVLEDAAALKESTSDEARVAQQASRRALAAAEPARLLFDAAIGVRLGVLQAPTAFDAKGIADTAATAQVQDALRDLMPAHFPVRFPEVFLREPAGFDVLLGNPPWKEATVEELKFWNRYFPGLIRRRSEDQPGLIAGYQRSRPDLVAKLAAEQASAAFMRAALGAGPYPGMGEGDPDVYKAFGWRFWQLLRRDGGAGVLLPRSAWVAKGGSEWRSVIFEGGSADIDLCRNTDGWLFDDVNPGYQITFLGYRRDGARRLTVRGEFGSLEEFVAGRGRATQPVPMDRLRASDPSMCVPSVSDEDDLALWTILIRQAGLGDPRLRGARTDLVCAPATELHATNDGVAEGIFTNSPDDWPVYNHLNVAHFRFDETAGAFNYADWDSTVDFLQRRRVRTRDRKDSPFSVRPSRWSLDPATYPSRHPRIVFRDVVHSSNQRKVWAALAPGGVLLTNKAPYLVFSDDDPLPQAYLLGVLSSGVVDWYGHLRVNLNLNFFILYSLPVPPYDPTDSRVARIASLAGRLVLRSGFDYGGWTAFGSPIDDDRERVDAIAELDAAVSLLFGIPDALLGRVFTRDNATRSSLDDVLTWRQKWSGQP